MLKLAGALGVLLPCMIFGFLNAQKLKKRCDSLLLLKTAIERMGAEISFTKKRIERIFAEISRDFKLPVFYDTSLSVKGAGLEKAWRDSLKKYSEPMALSDSDIKALYTIGKLSHFSGEEQQRCIHTLLKLLELSYAEAAERYSRVGKLYKSSGVLVGLLAVILLF